MADASPRSPILILFPYTKFIKKSIALNNNNNLSIFCLFIIYHNYFILLNRFMGAHHTHLTSLIKYHHIIIKITAKLSIFYVILHKCVKYKFHSPRVKLVAYITSCKHDKILYNIFTFHFILQISL
jgi:hypothetical protein